MNILVVLIVIILLFGGLGYGTGWYNSVPYGGVGYGGGLVTLIVVLVLLRLLGAI